MNDRGSWITGVAHWREGDIAFISVPFTWRLLEARKIAEYYRSLGCHVRAGGRTEGLKMRVLICGGRDFTDYDLLANTLDAGRTTGDLKLGPTEGVIIHGGARGADRLAAQYAAEVGIQCAAFPADWSKHGRRAGPIRNQQMIDQGKPDVVIAFPGGRGTFDMTTRARKAGISVVEVEAREAHLKSVSREGREVKK